MKNVLRYILSAMIMMVALSCVDELEGPLGENPHGGNKVKMTFSASLGEDSKVALIDGTDIWWTPGDQILVNGDIFDTMVQEPSRTASFVGETMSADKYHAVFAQSISEVRWEGSSYVINLPTYQASQLDAPSTYLSAAESLKQDGTLCFSNLLGYVKFTLPSEYSSAEAVVISSNGGEILSGNKASIDFSGSKPSLKIMELQEYEQSCPYVYIFSFWDVPGEYYAALYPGTYSKGLKITIRMPDGTEASKSINQEITLEPGVVQNIGVLKDFPEFENQQDKIRDALMRFYNATGGDDWINNEGWGTDQPLNLWYGVFVQSDGRGVYEMDLDLGFNNLKGVLSKEVMSSLEVLTRLYVSDNSLQSIDLTGNTNLVALACDNNLFSELDLRGLDNLTLLWCYNSTISNLLLEGCVSLKELHCWGSYLTSLDLSTNVNLEYLYASDTRLETLDLSNCASLEVVNCSNNHPDYGLKSINVSGLQNLRELNCGSNFLESIDLTSVPNLEVLDFNVDFMSSIDVSHNPKLRHLTGYRKFAEPDDLPDDAVGITEVDLSNNPDLEIFAIASKGITSVDFSHNPKLRNVNLTACRLESLDVRCLPLLEGLTCNNAGLTSLDVSHNPRLSSLLCMRNYISELDLSYNHELNTIKCTENLLTELDVSGCPFLEWLETWGNPNLESIDVLSTQNFEYNIDKWTDFVFKDGGDWDEDDSEDPELPELYESVDYSQDGVVVTLQNASVGNGIDIVLMGDGYSDRLIADGTYEDVMEGAMEKFFSEEPYKSFREYFNVYYVTVVSKNEVFGEGMSTALSGYFGDGTYVSGDIDKVMAYSMNVLEEEEMDDATVIVMLNSTNYAGTCFMYMYSSLVGDYGHGLTISFCPTAENDETFAQIIQHEAGGHGFGKLGDEYANWFAGEMPDWEKEGLDAMGEYGWYRNVDYRNDENLVKWRHFLSDERYAGEGLGVYEGAFTYEFKAYRPSWQSIMRHNVYGFNAPSREAIYYRIHKLAYGADWEYDYEKFVEYDTVNRFTMTKSEDWKCNYVEKEYPHTAPPVIIYEDWRTYKN